MPKGIFGFQIGNTVWLGRKHSEEARQKMSKAKRGKKTNEDHPHWKGDNVGYVALHGWVKRRLGKPNQCEKCGENGSGHRMHWANKSGEYKRDLSDWLRLCAKCHKRYDTKRLPFCKRGHKWTKENSMINKKRGTRNCRECYNMAKSGYNKKWRLKCSGSV